MSLPDEHPVHALSRFLEDSSRGLPTSFYSNNIQLDIRETDREYHIRADLPGIAKDEVKVTVSANVLTISGERKKEDKFETESYVYQERAYGKKSRSISLPGDADENHITTSFINGVLDLNIPKVASKASFKTIEVK